MRQMRVVREQMGPTRGTRGRGRGRGTGLRWMSYGKKKTPTPPKAVPILSPDEQYKFIFDEEKILEEILLQEEIHDLKIVVISIAGAFREGKSFLLNIFLRYMKHNASWLDDENIPSEGFNWKNGSTRCTTGILMWSEIFTVILPGGEKVAVIFLDTQGTFDPKSSDRENVQVFALSTLLSSVQIFNVFHLFREDYLQHLELFSSYGRLLMEQTEHKPFQKLQILVRDWRMPYEKKYGSEDGRAYLEEVLQVSSAQHSDQRASRDFVKSVYDDIQCYLMPSPGDRVHDADFDGRLCDLKKEFKEHLAKLVPNLLKPENLVLKEIAGQKITVKEWFLYLKRYVDIFDGNDLPEPRSMLAATAEIRIQSMIESAKNIYIQFMRENFNNENSKPYMTSEHLKKVHLKNKEKALKQYNKKRQFGSDALLESSREKLEKAIEFDYTTYVRENQLNKMKFEAAVIAGTISYQQGMDEAFNDPDAYYSDDDLNRMHQHFENIAIKELENHFKEADESNKKYRMPLQTNINAHFELCSLKNNEIRSEHTVGPAGAIVGASSGALSGGSLGGIIGATLGPIGIAVGSIGGALIGSIVGGISGAAIAGINAKEPQNWNPPKYKPNSELTTELL